MDILSVIGAALGLDSLYRTKTPKILPESKPRFCWMPKYVAAIIYAGEIRDADDGVKALEKRLGESGFALESRDSNSVTFCRGHFLGDLSIKRAKLRLVFEIPLGAESNVRTEYAGPLLLFDTGGLWTFTRGLTEQLAGR